MAVYVTAITPHNANDHESVNGIRWLDSSNSTSKTMTRAEAVDWVKKGNALWVAGDTGPVKVEVVEGRTPYLRTVANGKYSDNLLALPRY